MIRPALLLVALSLTSCSLFGGKQPDAADLFNALGQVCEAYQYAPPELRTKNQDIACQQYKRICVDGPIVAPIPAYGNKVVDAGMAGSGGSQQ